MSGFYNVKNPLIIEYINICLQVKVTWSKLSFNEVKIMLSFRTKNHKLPVEVGVCVCVVVVLRPR